LRDVRSSKALELLEYPGISIADVSFRLGFRDPDAFSRAFRIWTGVAPTEHSSRRRNVPLRPVLA
jgi:AraC-like DNA-binding protein